MNSPRIITVLNGPNLSQLGNREPSNYGDTTQSELIGLIEQKASVAGVSIDFFQSDIEGELVQAIGRASGNSIGIVINPAAYSHYSIAILDALNAFDGPVVEVHISQVLSRESFRTNLITARGADVFIAGAGVTGYLHAIDIVCELACENSS
ncbi:MAG: 3-dehydroquinate dehydratase [Candidatus Fermentibacteraceae bacterium]|nr:3-dehydroquinate dehydratase [Candidatus Fermentibacteraceae bacterium]